MTGIKLAASLASSNRAAQVLTEYLHQVSEIYRTHQPLRAQGYAYDSPEAFLLQHGQGYPPRPLPRHIPHGAPRACFGNAIVAAVLYDLIYVEGYAMVDMGGAVLPFEHAWCTDGQGQLYEVTWPVPGSAYLGVEFSVERADDCTWNGDANVLHDWRRRWPLLKQPWTGEPLLQTWPVSPRLELLREEGSLT